MNTKQLLISAAVAGILGAGPLATKLMAKEPAAAEKGKCQEANSCKGHGACHSMDGKNDCAGHNSCKNHAFKGTKEECAKVKGKWSKA